eukprot:4242895-Amphidinium_carterae.1
MNPSGTPLPNLILQPGPPVTPQYGHQIANIDSQFQRNLERRIGNCVFKYFPSGGRVLFVLALVLCVHD